MRFLQVNGGFINVQHIVSIQAFTEAEGIRPGLQGTRIMLSTGGIYEDERSPNAIISAINSLVTI